MTSSEPIVPTYRALTIVGTVIQHDEQGDVHHPTVVDTTLFEEDLVVVYDLRTKR